MPRLRFPFILAVLLLAACTTDRNPMPAPEVEAAAEAVPAVPAAAATFAGHRYKIYDLTDAVTSWTQAKAHCESLGGHLAVIETAEEQAFLAEHLQGLYAYLGATDEIEEDTWVWVNGAPWAYTSWMDGQPNNYGGEENYLATYDGGDWVDVAVEGDDFWMPTCYVCEWPVAP